MGGGRTTKKAVEGPQATKSPVLVQVENILYGAANQLRDIPNQGKRKKQVRDLADELEGRADLVGNCSWTGCKL